MEEAIYAELDRLREDLRILMERRDKAGESFLKLVEERRRLISEIRELRGSLREVRESKARLIEMVRDLRERLKQAREKLRNSVARLEEIRRTYPDLERIAGVSISSLKRRIDSLEWKIITGQVDPEEEEEIIRQVMRLETQLDKILKAKNVKNMVTEIRAEIASSRLEIDDIRRSIAEVSRGINEIKKKESELIEEIGKRSARIDEISKELDRLATDRSKISEEIRRKREEIQALRSRLREIRTGQDKKSRTERLEILKKKAEEKLSSGERLTFEELQALYGGLDGESNGTSGGENP
ncbi:MAG: hypothetical protein QXI22_02795 [Sulfolobales archaeon]